ncbi:hypothetical protein CLOM_g21470 [Closterium sp. NIES-68]|nr:hypothetical protein CLOM_g21470 [Closterium sp. NIES-68]GJP81187.1 hypothetical protein CLOP_g11354 [Closterium sp. NIES-67]
MAEEDTARPQEEVRGSAQQDANMQGGTRAQGAAGAPGEARVQGEVGGAELMETTVAPKQGLSLLLTSADLISQGAEARVFAATFCGRPAILKQRFEKKYRHPVLDARLTAKRLHAEARSMVRAARLGVLVPVLYGVEEGERCIVMQRVVGRSVKHLLLSLAPPQSTGTGTGSSSGVSIHPRVAEVAAWMGEAIAKLHDGGMVHGDLTTSNMLLSPAPAGLKLAEASAATATAPTAEAAAAAAAEAPGAARERLVLIDFGLSFNSTIAEDKAVDLYVLERALISLHSSNGDIMSEVLTSYRHHSRFWSATLNKLGQVRLRGRKRAMVG